MARLIPGFGGAFEMNSRKRYAMNLVRKWENDRGKKNKSLDLMVTLDNNGKDVLQHLVEEYAKPGHYITNAGVLSFHSDLDFAKDLVYAWTEGRNSLASSYEGTISGIQSIEVSGKVRTGPLRKSRRKSGEGWNLEFIGVKEAQRFGRGEGIKIGIIDTGIDYNHKEISSRFGREKGVNIIDPSKDPVDGNGHGTHVAGTAAGKEVGIANKASLYAIKVLNDRGSGTESDVIAGMDWAISKGLDVVNMSLGGPGYTRAFQELCYAAAMKNMLVVAAAGNSGREGGGESYPAAYDNVISVASIGENGERSSFSNRSITLDIAAPGENIYSSVPDNGYDSYNGTSMASPHVAGSLALLMSFSKNNSLEALIKKTSGRPPAPYDRKLYGAGLLKTDEAARSNENAAVRMLKKVWKVLY